MERVILLNGDYSYLNTISWKKAMCLITKGKVEVIKASKKIIRSVENAWEITIPIVLRLIKFIRTIYKTRVPFSKRNILYRDEFTCQYCGQKRPKLTVDHIIPKSRGGRSSFENCVASCKPCNNKKENRTPSEAKMPLLRKPVQPTIMEFLHLRMKTLKIDILLKELGVY